LLDPEEKKKCFDTAGDSQVRIFQVAKYHLCFKAVNISHARKRDQGRGEDLVLAWHSGAEIPQKNWPTQQGSLSARFPLS